MTKETHKGKHLIGIQFQRFRVHANKANPWWQEVEIHTLNCKQDTEKVDWEKQEAFNSLKPILPRHTPQNKTLPPNPSLTILPTGDQVLKDKNVWEPLLVKFSQNVLWIELCFKPN